MILRNEQHMIRKLSVAQGSTIELYTEKEDMAWWTGEEFRNVIKPRRGPAQLLRGQWIVRPRLQRSLGKRGYMPACCVGQDKKRTPAGIRDWARVCMHMEGKGIEKHSLARACFRPLMHVKYPTVRRHDFSIML